MLNKKILIGLAVLTVVSIAVLINNNIKADKNTLKDIPKVSENNTIQESSEKDIIPETDDLPSETDEVEQTIWVKNMDFLAKHQTLDIIMNLKYKLNDELKTIDKKIYEVNLLEDTYKEDDKGFVISAKADKLEGTILIDFHNLNFKFQIIR